MGLCKALQGAICKSFRVPVDPVKRAKPWLAAERGHQSLYELAVEIGVVRHNKICLSGELTNLSVVEPQAAN
jgi:hypothetical protein